MRKVLVHSCVSGIPVVGKAVESEKTLVNALSRLTDVVRVENTDVSVRNALLVMVTNAWLRGLTKVWNIVCSRCHPSLVTNMAPSYKMSSSLLSFSLPRPPVPISKVI